MTGSRLALFQVTLQHNLLYVVYVHYNAVMYNNVYYNASKTTMYFNILINPSVL